MEGGEFHKVRRYPKICPSANLKRLKLLNNEKIEVLQLQEFDERCNHLSHAQSIIGTDVGITHCKFHTQAPERFLYIKVRKNIYRIRRFEIPLSPSWDHTNLGNCKQMPQAWEYLHREDQPLKDSVSNPLPQKQRMSITINWREEQMMLSHVALQVDFGVHESYYGVVSTHGSRRVSQTHLDTDSTSSFAQLHELQSQPCVVL